jgi:hypothetical protein
MKIWEIYFRSNQDSGRGLPIRLGRLMATNCSVRAEDALALARQSDKWSKPEEIIYVRCIGYAKDCTASV